MKEEIWKDIYFIDNGIIYDYRGLYQVSNFGRVKSFPRHGTHTKEEHILTLIKNHKGYLTCRLTKKSKSKFFSVHRLVAKMFISNPENKPQVNHIDGNKENNYVSNLEFCTNGENGKHAWINGLRTKKYGKDSKSARKIIQYSLNMKQIKVWGSIIDIERELGFKKSNICHCCRNQRPTAYGYFWRYLN